jgi:6-phosphofructokinase 1
MTPQLIGQGAPKFPQLLIQSQGRFNLLAVPVELGEGHVDNEGKRVNVVNQWLDYLVRCGDSDAIDSIVPMAFGNLALDLVLQQTSERLVSLRHGCYDNVPIEVVTAGCKKVVNVEKYYSIDRLRPKYETFMRQPLLIMTSEV